MGIVVIGSSSGRNAACRNREVSLVDRNDLHHAVRRIPTTSLRRHIAGLRAYEEGASFAPRRARRARASRIGITRDCADRSSRLVLDAIRRLARAALDLQDVARLIAPCDPIRFAKGRVRARVEPAGRVRILRHGAEPAPGLRLHANGIARAPSVTEAHVALEEVVLGAARVAPSRAAGIGRRRRAAHRIARAALGRSNAVSARFAREPLVKRALSRDVVADHPAAQKHDVALAAALPVAAFIEGAPHVRRSDHAEQRGDSHHDVRMT